MSTSPQRDTLASTAALRTVVPAHGMVNADPDDPRAVTKRERAAFALGDIASNLTWTTISSYLLFFYTDVALMSAGIAGTVMLIARILDAVFDPAVGVALDRTATRWGRARPYLIFGAPLLAVLTVATFLTPGGGNDFFTVGYAAVTFVLVGLAYSLVNVPYGAAMAMSTRDSGMRMKLAGMRSFGVGIGIIIVSTFTQPLIEFVGGSTTSKFGFAVVIGLYSAVGLVLFWVVSRWVKERVPATPVTKAKGNLGASLRALAGNLPWLAVVAFSILAFARLGVITGGAVYFAIYALGNPGAIPIVLFAFSLSAVVGSLLTAPILKWLGQRRAVIIGLVISIAFTPVLYLVKDDLLLFAIAFFLANIVGGFGFVAAPAFIADTVEWQEARAGRRDEGLLFAGYSMSTKIGAALGSALLAWGLAAIGYTPGVVNESAANGVLWLFLGLPVIISVLQIVAISCYRLEGRLATVKEQARARREETLRHGQDQ